MNKERAEKIKYMIQKECQRQDLTGLCEDWGVTTEELDEFLEYGVSGVGLVEMAKQLREEGKMNELRHYIAISIKHSVYDKRDGKYILWGDRRTKDDEKRCFAGYRKDIDTCELYSLNDFQEKYSNGCVKYDEAVPMKIDLCKRYKQYDTVLVEIDDYKKYLELL